MSTFTLDPRLAACSIKLADWPLCQVLLKNDADYPWAMLVPTEPNITEICDLTAENQQQLIAEIAQLSRIMRETFQPIKLNVGALGNIVSQLHVHVIARQSNDKAWPHGVWQPSHQPVPYANARLAELVAQLSGQL